MCNLAVVTLCIVARLIWRWVDYRNLKASRPHENDEVIMQEIVSVQINCPNQFYFTLLHLLFASYVEGKR